MRFLILRILTHSELGMFHEYRRQKKEGSKQREPLRKPYPKRVRSDTDYTAGDQSAKGGSTPTRTLQVRKKKVVGS